MARWAGQGWLRADRELRTVSQDTRRLVGAAACTAGWKIVETSTSDPQNATIVPRSGGEVSAIITVSPTYRQLGDVRSG